LVQEQFVSSIDSATLSEVLLAVI